MGKKKAKGKGKAKEGGGSAGGLPPPPDFSGNREGALEALLSFRIKGTESSVEQFTEESEEFKDKNYQQLSRNNQIKREKLVYLRKLLEEAKQLAEKLRAAETISRSDVEKAMLDKLCNVKDMKQGEIDLKKQIENIDSQLESLHEELAEIQQYREDIQYQNKEHISKKKAEMEKWTEEEEDIQTKLSSELEASKHKVDQQLVIMSEKQRERTSERLMQSMDVDTKTEIADNLWLKEQIRILRGTESNLQKHVSELEDRNLKLMELMYNERKEELEASQRLFGIANRHSTPLELMKVGSTSLLSSPSAGSRTQLIPSETTLTSRPIDIGLLSIEGNKFPVRPAPEHIHLPPIEEQRNQTLQLRANWPVTGRMLKSLTSY